MKIWVSIFGLFITLFGCSTKQSKTESVVKTDTSNTKGFVINGILDMEGVKEVNLLVDRKIVQTAKVEDNRFVLTGSVDKPIKGVISDKDNSFNIPIILENDTYQLETKDSYAVVKGSPLHEEVFGFIAHPEFITLNRELLKTEKEAFDGLGVLDHEGLKKARVMVKGIEDKVFNYENNYLNNVIEKGSSAYAKLFALSESYDWDRYSVQQRLKMLDEYEKSIGNHPDINMNRKVLKEDLKKGDLDAELKAGMSYKNVIATDRNGNKVDLSKIIAENNFTILEFWASWCSPCRAEIPNLMKAYKKYKAKGLEIVSVSIDKKSKSWIQALDKEQTTWISTIVENGFNNEYVKSYGISAIPASYLITKDGTILASNDELREANLEKTLSRIVAGSK